MSNTSAAIKAAKEVQADVLAPVLYRDANEWFQKAKAEYKFKNFEAAEQYAIRARKLAEQAEFEVIKNAGSRVEPVSEPVPSDAAPAPTSTYEYPTPTATPYDRANAAPSGGGTTIPVPQPY